MNPRPHIDDLVEVVGGQVARLVRLVRVCADGSVVFSTDRPLPVRRGHGLEAFRAVWYPRQIPTSGHLNAILTVVRNPFANPLESYYHLDDDDFSGFQPY